MDEMQIKQGEIIMDLTIRVTALEKLLIKNNIITDQEFMDSLIEVRDSMMKMITETLSKQ